MLGGNERTCSVIFVKTDRTNCLKLVWSPRRNPRFEFSKSDPPKRHFTAHLKILNCKISGDGKYGARMPHVKKKKKKNSLLHISLYVPHITQNSHKSLNIWIQNKPIVQILGLGLGFGYICSKYSDPVEAKSLLLLNVCHRRRKTANQI